MLRENVLEVFNKNEITKDHIVVIKIDCGNMLPHDARAYMKSIRDTFQNVNYFNPAHVIVMPISNSIEILNKEDYVNN